MVHELWRTLEEEEEGEVKGRRPEIGHVFFLDRGRHCRPALEAEQSSYVGSPWPKSTSGQPGLGSAFRCGLRDGAVLPGGLRGPSGRHLPNQVW